MKVLSIIGSPRKQGNTAVLAGRFCETAEGLGAKTRTIFLNELDFKGCQACYACKTTRESCILDDDLTPVLEAMHAADIMLLGSPVYFHEVTGQFKLFWDRTFSLLTPDFLTGPKTCRLPTGKQVVFIQTQAAAPELFADIFPRFAFMKDLFGLAGLHLLRGCGLQEPGQASADAGLMAQAGQLAERLVGQGR
jgi:multimeric flavodoxin WrbA